MANEMMGMDMVNMGAEEYFETNPNETSFDIDNTNRDLITSDNVPIDMMSPENSAFEVNEDKDTH